MPVTFKAFLQGLAAAAPDLIKIRQYEIDNDRQERLAAASIAASEAQARYTDTQTDSAKAAEQRAAEMQPYVKDEAKYRAEEQKNRAELTRINKEIKALEEQRERDPNSTLNKTRTQELANLRATHDKLVGDSAVNAAQIAQLNASTSAMGLTQKSAFLEYKSKMLNLVASLNEDPAAQDFILTEHNSVPEMISAIRNTKMSPKTIALITGMTGEYEAAVAQALQNVTQINANVPGTGRGAEKQKNANLQRAYQNIVALARFNQWDVSAESDPNLAAVFNQTVPDYTDQTKRHQSGQSTGNQQSKSGSGFNISGASGAVGNVGFGIGALGLAGAGSVLSRYTK